MTTPSAGLPAAENRTLPDNEPLLDVRERDEWDRGHAPRAILISLHELADRLDDLPPARPLHVICRSGGRSARAVELLRSRGIDAVNVTGGMLAWQAAGRPMTTGTGVGAPSVE